MRYSIRMKQSLGGAFFFILITDRIRQSVRTVRKDRVILCALSLFFILCLGCSYNSMASVSSDEDYDGVLRIGIDSDFPPFTYINNLGEYDGFDIALAREVCLRMNYELIIIPINWEDRELILKQGEVDCIWSCLAINESEDDFLFSRPYLTNGQYFIVRADSEIQSLSDFVGKNVAVQRATTAQMLLFGEYQDFSSQFDHIYELSNNETALLYLTYGEADAVLLDGGNAQYYIWQNPSQYRMLETPLSKSDVAIGFAKDNTILCENVENIISQMQQDGTFTEIASQWGLETQMCVWQGEDE